MGYVEELRALVGHRQLNLCGSCVLVENPLGELLLQQRMYPAGRWCFPGGLMELGESAEDTARRELWEETALKVDKLELLGVYSGPEHLCRAANGDEWYVITIAYTTDCYSGQVKINDGESMALAWFAPEAMPEGLVSTHKKILADYLRRRDGQRGKEEQP